MSNTFQDTLERRMAALRAAKDEKNKEYARKFVEHTLDKSLLFTDKSVRPRTYE
jgi:hypothetical protein